MLCLGKITRILLKKFNKICAAEEDYDGDNLEITEVNEPEKQPQKKRTFRNIFGNAEQSQVLAPNNSPFDYDSDQEFSGVPCSTFVDPEQIRRRDILAEREAFREVSFCPTDAAPESSIPDVCPTDAVDSVAAPESSIDLIETTVDPYQMKVKDIKDWLRKKIFRVEISPH